MSKLRAREDLDNAMANANNVIAFAQKTKLENHDMAVAIESIGFSLHAIARALKEMTKD